MILLLYYFNLNEKLFLNLYFNKQSCFSGFLWIKYLTDLVIRLLTFSFLLTYPEVTLNRTNEKKCIKIMENILNSYLIKLYIDPEMVEFKGL